MDRELFEVYTEDTKGRKITMPITTKKQISRDSDGKESEVAEYNIKKPMSFKAFKKMPLDLQKEYLHFLLTEFNVSYGAIAKAFEITKAYLSQYIAKKKIKPSIPRTSRQPKDEDVKRLMEFFAKPTTGEISEYECKHQDTSTQTETALESKNNSFDFDYMSMSFRGTVGNLEGMMERIREIVKDGRQIDINISVASGAEKALKGDMK